MPITRNIIKALYIVYAQRAVAVAVFGGVKPRKVMENFLYLGGDQSMVKLCGGSGVMRGREVKR